MLKILPEAWNGRYPTTVGRQVAHLQVKGHNTLMAHGVRQWEKRCHIRWTHDVACHPHSDGSIENYKRQLKHLLSQMGDTKAHGADLHAFMSVCSHSTLGPRGRVPTRQILLLFRWVQGKGNRDGCWHDYTFSQGGRMLVCQYTFYFLPYINSAVFLLLDGGPGLQLQVPGAGMSPKKLKLYF